MKIKITQIEFKSVAVEKEFELPTFPCYYFITGEINSYSVVPRFTSWEKEPTLYRYDIIQIGLSFECKIDAYSVRVHELPDILKDHKKQGHSIMRRIVYYPTDGVRTKERFMNDFDQAINELKILLKY